MARGQNQPEQAILEEWHNEAAELPEEQRAEHEQAVEELRRELEQSEQERGLGHAKISELRGDASGVVMTPTEAKQAAELGEERGGAYKRGRRG